MLNLGTEWKQVLRKAWSIRLWALGFVCDVSAILFLVWGQFSEAFITSIVLQCTGTIFGFAAFVARLLVQKNFNGTD